MTETRTFSGVKPSGNTMSSLASAAPTEDMASGLLRRIYFDHFFIFYFDHISPPWPATRTRRMADSPGAGVLADETSFKPPQSPGAGAPSRDDSRPPAHSLGGAANERNERNIPCYNSPSSLLAGGLAGLCADATLQPLDFVKTRQQLALARGGVLSTIRDTIRQHGVRFLYKGFGAVACISPFSNATFYAGYDAAKERVAMMVDETRRPVLTHSISGFAAIGMAALLMVPADIMLQRSQSTNDRANSSFRVFRAVMGKEGVRGFYKRYWASIGVWGPYCSIYFATYEKLKSNMGLRRSEEASGFRYLVCSAVAGVAGAVLTNPLDVIRVRRQVAGVGGLHTFRYTSIMHAFSEIWRTEGARGFTRGLVARVCWFVPNDAIGMTLYEKLKHKLDPIWKGNS